MLDDLFDEVYQLPDPIKQREFHELIGLDETKQQLLKEGTLLLDPGLLDTWSKKYHRHVLKAVKDFHNRPPLIVFCGDIGTGKTTLAESFGDSIARTEKIVIHVLRLSLMTRGAGAVGEMTRLITHAFREVETLGKKARGADRKPSSAVVLIIDEADAIAQSREFDQMHHEDRAGVNALIRGIDLLTASRLPVIVVMCTNRRVAIDPAVLRRASAIHEFQRPTKEQRAHVLKEAFGDTLMAEDIEKLAELTGTNPQRDYGYTYSDLRHRLIPSIVLEAYPNRPIDWGLVKSVLQKIQPTKPFLSS